MISTQLFYSCGDGICIHIKSFQCGGDVVVRIDRARASINSATSSRPAAIACWLSDETSSLIEWNEDRGSIRDRWVSWSGVAVAISKFSENRDSPLM